MGADVVVRSRVGGAIRTGVFVTVIGSSSAYMWHGVS